MFARLKAEHDHQRKTCSGISPKTCFCLPSILGAHGCGPWLVRGTRLPACRICCLFTISNIRASHTQEGRREPHLTFQTSKNWWSLSGSNRRPEACKATALPAELRPPCAPKGSTIMVGLGRLERPTSPLSGVRSNHLSYRPSRSWRHP